MADEDILSLLAELDGSDGSQKPFGNQTISEDEAVEMDRK
jgi:hypothetical protein